MDLVRDTIISISYSVDSSMKSHLFTNKGTKLLIPVLHVVNQLTFRTMTSHYLRKHRQNKGTKLLVLVTQLMFLRRNTTLNGIIIATVVRFSKIREVASMCTNTKSAWANPCMPIVSLWETGNQCRPRSGAK